MGPSLRSECDLGGFTPPRPEGRACWGGSKWFGSTPREPCPIDVCTCFQEKQVGSSPAASGTRWLPGAFPGLASRPLHRCVGADVLGRPRTPSGAAGRHGTTTSRSRQATQSGARGERDLLVVE